MSKWWKKYAAIRKNDSSPCPFGLPIPFACECAGSCIDRMAPISIVGKNPTPEEAGKIGKANVRLLSACVMSDPHEPQPCRYAAKVFEQQNGVECNYEDTAPGQTNNAVMEAAPSYSQLFSGVGLNGLYSFPIGYYADYDLSRNSFYGLMSLCSADKEELQDLLVKMAALEEDKCK